MSYRAAFAHRWLAELPLKAMDRLSRVAEKPHNEQAFLHKCAHTLKDQHVPATKRR